jgi:hypothetical protein
MTDSWTDNGEISREHSGEKSRERSVAASRYLVAVGALMLGLLSIAPEALAQKAAKMSFNGGLLNTLVGACATTTYNTICPSGSCGCQIYVVDTDHKSQKVTGNLVGKSTLAEIDITLDGGDSVGGGTPGFCRPIFASATITGSIDTEQLDMTGAICSPTKKGGVIDPISGGFGIESSTASHQGFGTFTGTLNETTGLLVLKFSGLAN